MDALPDRICSNILETSLKEVRIDTRTKRMVRRFRLFPENEASRVGCSFLIDTASTKWWEGQQFRRFAGPRNVSLQHYLRVD